MAATVRAADAFSHQRFTQLLMMEGQPPAAAVRLEHDDVVAIREQAMQRARALFQQSLC
jgi:hypothetical protein